MYKIYGRTTSGTVPTEEVEMASFFNRLRSTYPDTYGAIAIHIRNEGKRNHRQMTKIKSQGGFVKGASDVIIPGSPAFVMEMKSTSKSSKVGADQVAYLTRAAEAGAFACVAYGASAAWEALQDWLNAG